MTKLDQGPLTATAAETYDSFFVPALFDQWTTVVLDAAAVGQGDRVLDVGGGSGVLARAAVDRVGPRGAVAGVDPSENMLAVARRSTSAVDWRVGSAEDLSFADDTFDRVVSQFALMFFNDPAAGLRELARVARPHGRIALGVWASLDHSPGYAALTGLVERLFGSVAADALRAPFALGDPAVLATLMAETMPEAAITTHHGMARFDSLTSWLATEVRGWTLAELIDEDGLRTLVRHGEDELREFVHGDGVAFPVVALVASGEVAADAVLQDSTAG